MAPDRPSNKYAFTPLSRNAVILFKLVHVPETFQPFNFKVDAIRLPKYPKPKINIDGDDFVET